MISWIPLPGAALAIVLIILFAVRDGRNEPPLGKVLHAVLAVLVIPLVLAAATIIHDFALGHLGPTTALVPTLALLAPTTVMAPTYLYLLRHHWRGRGWWILATPFGLLLLAIIFPGQLTETSPGTIILGLAFLAAAIVIPPGAARLAARDHAGAQAAAAFLAATILFAAGPNLLFVPLYFTENGQQAEQTWTLTITPDDASRQSTYTIQYPFLAATNARTQESLERLHPAMTLSDGDGSWQWLDGRQTIEITAIGTTTLVAETGFYGDIGQREAFDYALPGGSIILIESADGRNGTAHVHVDFSGGTGHTCWLDGNRTDTIGAPPGEPKGWPLQGDFLEGTSCA